MESNTKPAGATPARSRYATTPEVPAAPVEYETAKGCLSFALVGLVITGLIVAVIVLVGHPAMSAAGG